MKTMECNQCGEELVPEVNWHYEMLQVVWQCEECRCGFVRDVYFTGNGAPSSFEDANLQGYPTDEEIHLVALMADKERLDTWHEEQWKPSEDQEWSEGRGYGNFEEGL